MQNRFDRGAQGARAGFNFRLRLRHLASALVILISSLSPFSQALAQSDGGRSALKIEAVRYVTWWFHSAMGYHPAILIVLQNSSGQDLSGVLLKVQGRFQNLRDGYVTVAREESRNNFEPRKQIIIFLRAPRAFELPIDQDLWPRMECKVMCRVGDSGDDGTQSLLLTKLDSITMSYEDAMTTLSKQPDIRFLKRPSIARSAPPAGQRTPSQPEKPLVAMAASLTGKPEDKPKLSIAQFMSASFIPGLGDDFYSFEKKYGMPVEFDAGTKDWTWARYQNASPEVSVIVGSMGQTGKADMIVVTVPGSQMSGESKVAELAKSMSGKFRAEAVSQPTHSVRYLPQGRLEFGTLQAKNYRAVYFVPGDTPAKQNSFIVVVTRLPGNVLNILRREAPKAKLLRFLVPVTGVEES